MMRHLRWLLVLHAFVVSGAAIHADNWPRFRGPNGTGVAADKDVPVQWSPADGILWKVAIPGIGHSSPVIWGKHIFLQTATPDGTERFLLCLSTGDGKTLWSRSFKGAKARVHQKGTLANSTPATDGERVYIAFWDGVHQFLYAYDFKGEELWHQDLGSFKSQHGAGCSPIVYGDRVIFANEQDGQSAVLGFDARTGAKAWEMPRKGFRTCYATPFIREAGDGGPEAIVASTAGIAAYDVKTGQESWHWVFRGKPGVRAVGSPLMSAGLILVSLGNGEGDRHTVCVKPGEKGVSVDGQLAWESKKGSLAYVPCWLTLGEHVYSVTDKGFAECYVAKTGEEIWHERLGGEVTASPILVDGKIYAAAENGTVYVFPAATTFKLLAKNDMGEAVMATPAVADGKLYVRGSQHLFCIGKAGK
jgi:outer membrane protein assembly factor BamB